MTDSTSLSPIVQDDAFGESIATFPKCNRAPSPVVSKDEREVNDMMAMTRERAFPVAADRDLRFGSWLMGAAAVGFIGYAVIFLIRNFTDSFLELGIGPNEVNVGREAIQNFSPSLFEYIGHLHIAVAGFIAATGVAVLFLVAFGVRRGERWAWVGAVAAPVLGLLVALPAHYPNHFDTFGHLGSIYLATLIFVAGALVALRGIMTLRKG
jgi:hypothetical protein